MTTNPHSLSGPSAPTRGPVQQLKPQPLAGKPSSGAAILVATRQKGNPILNHIKGLPWEYADIPADYVLGATTCALFLSLKYHKLHPEYIYGRIRALQGKYNLRILLTLVDIEAHEESLKELSKTSLVNNVTIILAWSAQEAGRYLELFKTYENAAPTSIKGHQSTHYVDRLVEFVTAPRSVNKTDAVSLVSNFGSIRTAVNAQPEDVALIAGWGDKKVKNWCTAVREPFRSERAAKKVLTLDNTAVTTSNMTPRPAPRHEAATSATSSRAEPISRQVPVEDDGDSLFVRDNTTEPSTSNVVAGRKRPAEPELSGGIAEALAKLRDKN